ncbi:MAG: helix-turn-helix domain-containing protein, partial [bacterium]
MLNKKRLQLQGLDVLGSRLRELRLRAGISQMKLAEILGLNPTHGYKYILRLEKGLVPNPTMRTITGYLIACGASWQELAAVLPGIKMVTVADNSEKTETAEPIIIPPSLEKIPKDEIKKLPLLGLN